MIQAYLKKSFPADLKAGFITSVVALPLAIAFAIASGVPPVMGLYTAIIAGILGSAFGGSTYSITGPTGAMTVIILSTVNKHGVEGLLMAGLLAGMMQLALGIFRIGRYVKFIPLPVVSGFTAGIGIIIFVGQIANGLGIAIPAEEFIGDTIRDIWLELSHAQVSAIGVTLSTMLLLWLLPRLFSKAAVLKNIPPSLIPLVASAAAVWYFGLSIPIVGEIPHTPPSFSFLAINYELAREVMPAALTIALLGAIEALLCAVVADGMTNTHHDSDKELRAQGIANIALPFFNGIAATAAIARTAVNIREGAKTKWAGVIHALFMLSFMLLFADQVALVPKAFLAGILMFVSLRMINLHEIRTIVHISRTDAAVMLLTLGLTVLTDLVFAVQVGMLLAIFLLFVRLVRVTNITAMEEYDDGDGINGELARYSALKNRVAIYTIHGPFFFGTMSLFDQKVNEHMKMSRPITILRMKHVPFIDATGLLRLKEFIRERSHRQELVVLSGVRPEVRERIHHDSELMQYLPEQLIFDRTFQAIAWASEYVAPFHPQRKQPSVPEQPRTHVQ